jgi:hypothetical protein
MLGWLRIGNRLSLVRSGARLRGGRQSWSGCPGFRLVERRWADAWRGPAEGMTEFLDALWAEGVSEDELTTMVSTLHEF